jgi:hypothetical protein
VRQDYYCQGALTEGESTVCVDLLINIASFVKMVNNTFNTKAAYLN